MTTAIFLAISLFCTGIALKALHDKKKDRSHEELVRHWATKAANSIVDDFPTLEVKLNKPIKNAIYFFNGGVSSVEEELQWAAKQFGQQITKNENKDELQCGRCLHLEIKNKSNIFHICVVFFRNGMPAVDELFVVAHEEFHVAQYLEAQEVFDSIKDRFLQRGYNIDWHIFNSEEQANLAGVLITWECGMPVEDTLELLKIHANGKNTYEKLQECKIA
jgi:hypothetical protein